ncbi:alpha/beta fold hydrolase [Pseudomonas massiliensis]|uniref:alpha/beta fold hydrolase n=1 Tax=Pseudomonas massiliensis TaxID=522492 RepID=UPI000590E7AE|nr:alpha/beta hydrolase [Pseudomonas massiliensis]
MNDPAEPIRFSLSHIELAGLRQGPRAAPPVIALHGWLDNANSFARLRPRLPGLHLLCLDLAGHGLSGHRPPGSLYPHWEYTRDILEVAGQLQWPRFSLVGHSMGAIIAAQLAAAMPERIERLVLIEGLVPPDGSPTDPAQRLGQALREQLAHPERRKPLYPDRAQAVRARCLSRLPVSESASSLLAERGLMAVEGGFTWRSDNRLTLTTPVRMEPAQAWAMVQAIQCPTLLLLGKQGLLAQRQVPLESLPFKRKWLPGRHHLHLDDDVGAELVAGCINSFILAP